MLYVKEHNFNGIETRQVACIELQGKPNAATEGAAGVLGIDMSSPRHDVYKCVAVNGSIYTWELFSGGVSTLVATISGNGAQSFDVPYEKLIIPDGYTVKVGDMVIDADGYVYKIETLYSTSCVTKYCGTQMRGADEIVISTEEPTDKRVKAWIDPEQEYPKELILASSTSGSTKNFKISVDDSGTIRAVEV